MNSDIGIQLGLSVPDADMPIMLAEVLDTSVSTLLGEEVIESEADEIKAMAEKLELINWQLAQRKIRTRKIVQGKMVPIERTVR